MSQPSTVDPVRNAVSRVGVAARCGTPDQLAAAKRELTAANCERAIQKALDAAPPLTTAQRKRLAVLLLSGTAR